VVPQSAVRRLRQDGGYPEGAEPRSPHRADCPIRLRNPPGWRHVKPRERKYKHHTCHHHGLCRPLWRLSACRLRGWGSPRILAGVAVVRDRWTGRDPDRYQCRGAPQHASPTGRVDWNVGRRSHGRDNRSGGCVLAGRVAEHVHP